MPNKWQLATAALAALVAYDVYYEAKLKKKLHLRAHAIVALTQQNQSLHEQMSYMCHKLNENEIALDEFDLIALPNVETK